MRAFVYCRVSTREQSLEDHYSLDNQEQRCRDYIAGKHWSVLKVRKDVASGKDDGRQGFQELRSDVLGGRIDVVVVYRLDRLSRNVRDIYGLLDSIREQGVGFVSVTEGFDTTTAMGRAMLGVAAVFAQLTREMIAENTKDGLARRAEAGYFRGNVAQLYGYDYSKERGVLEVNDHEAEVVRRVFTWYVEGKWGQRRIAHALNVEGIPSKTGVQWKLKSIVQILQNPVYCGEVRANGGTVPGRHEAIITKERFEAAQAVFASRRTLPPRSQQSNHLLSGIALCGMCGRRLRAQLTNAGARRVDGTRKRYRFYGHKGSVEAGERACSGLSKNADRLEEAVIGKIADVAASGAMKTLILEEVRNRTRESMAPLSKERERLRLELDRIGQQFTAWADRLDHGRIDEEQFSLQNERLLSRKREIQSRLAEIDLKLGEEEAVELTLGQVQAALEDFPRLWAALSLEEKREVLRLLIERLGVYKTHADLKLLFLDAVEIPLALQRGRKPAERGMTATA